VALAGLWFGLNMAGISCVDSEDKRCWNKSLSLLSIGVVVMRWNVIWNI